MALVVKDRVKETTTTTGTGTLTLAGAELGYQSFADALADGDTTWYGIEDGTDWEVGLGTIDTTAGTLARTTVYSSSNSGNAVNWGAGSKNIFITLPASQVNTVGTYATIDDVPSSASAGSFAFINENQRLLVYANSQWVSVELSNAKPVISGNNASYDLATDGTATVVTLTAVDPEGADITWSYTTSGLGSIATVSQNVNVFTITPSTNTADSGTFSITFRASDGDTLGTSTSEFTLDLFVPEYYPNQNEGFLVDFTDRDNMFQDLVNSVPVLLAGSPITSVRQEVDFGGSASYLIADPNGDADGAYTDTSPTLGTDGTNYFARMGSDQAYRLPTIAGDFDNCIFCICAKDFGYTNANSRMFSLEGAGITGNLSIGIAGAGGEIFCRSSGANTDFSVDSTNGITLNGTTPTVITVVIQSGVASFRENKVDLGNSGGGGPTASSARGCVLGGGYDDNTYQTTHDTYGAAFAYGTFTTADIEAFEDRLANLAGITL